jgi:parvulin-like peptidyl-prolyl isomerase
MSRSLPGRRAELIPPFCLVSLSSYVLAAAAIWGGSGCTSSARPLEDLGLASAVQARQQMELAQAAPAAGTITRSQKPDPEAVRKTDHRSVLDQASYQVTSPENTKVAARIRATVNGVAILDDELREFVIHDLRSIRSLPEPQYSDRQREIMNRGLEKLIEREVIMANAMARLKDRPQVLQKLEEAADKYCDKLVREQKKAARLNSDEEYKAALASQGMTWEGFRRAMKRKFMTEEYMKNLIIPRIDKVGMEQITEYYQQHPEEFQVPDSVEWQDIFLLASESSSREAAQQVAEKLAERARNGEDFLKLEAQFDRGPSRYRKGEGYGHKRGEIEPREAEAVLFQLKSGEVGPVVAVAPGFHVIKVVKREYAGLKPFDEKTQTAIKNKLQNDVWDIEYKRTVNEMKRKAAIEISAQ